MKIRPAVAVVVEDRHAHGFVGQVVEACASRDVF
jgi:hypothetical protein